MNPSRFSFSVIFLFEALSIQNTRPDTSPNLSVLAVALEIV